MWLLPPDLTQQNRPTILDTLKDSPLQPVESDLLDRAAVALSIKRDHLLDPYLGGNTWRKLKYNLQSAVKANQDTLLTFGGAWSNHIYATAAAGKKFGLNTIGIIRGERAKTLSATLQFAQQCNMQLKFVSRADYRNKTSAAFIQSLHQEFGDFYCLPEGGSNVLALKGVAELVDEITIDFDVITTPCGTGATLAGLVQTLNPEQTAKGYAVLKGADFLRNDVQNLLTEANIETQALWNIETDYHFGGYAKINDDLRDFIINFKHEFDIPLDAVYTGKMFYGLFDQIKNGAFKPGTTIVALHTGGLQGNAGFKDLKL